MARAIETHYLPTTNTLGSRIVATYGKTAKRVVGYDYALSAFDNHREAAKALRKAVFLPDQWEVPMIVADTAKGYVHVWEMAST